MISGRRTYTISSSFFRLLLVAGLFLLMIGLPQRPARAAAIRRVKPLGVTTGQCTTWLEACSLQRALTLSVPGDEIWALAGTYLPTVIALERMATFQLKNGVAIYGGFDGAETTRDERDPITNVSILSGAIGQATPADNSYHVVTGSGTDNTALLDGFTITLGYAYGIEANQNLGAGIFLNNGSPTLVNIIFSNNTATTDGGAVYNLGGNPIFNQVSFINNTASNNGGAIFNTAGAAPRLTNVTFSGSDAGDSGGGMYNDQSSPTLTNVTFSDNVASVGGAMTNVNASTPSLRNSILWGNEATSSNPEIDNQDTSTAAVTYSVVEGGYAGTGNLSADPLLGPLGPYGSSTQMLALLPGSAAIDSGDAAVCPAIDQRGVTRPQGTGCDMGAFESRGFTLALVSGDNQTTDSNTAFAQPLAVSISSSFGEPIEDGVIHFSAPASGTSADLSPSDAVIAMGGASATATANQFGGSYLVTAGGPGIAVPVVFHLTNIGPPPNIIFLPLIFR